MVNLALLIAERYLLFDRNRWWQVNLRTLLAVTFVTGTSLGLILRLDADAAGVTRAMTSPAAPGRRQSTSAMPSKKSTNPVSSEYSAPTIRTLSLAIRYSSTSEP